MTALVTFGAVALGAGLWLWMLRAYDRIEPESIRHLLLVGIIGGAGSVVVAAFMNEAFRAYLGVFADVLRHPDRIPQGQLALLCLFVGLNEELWKASIAIFVTRQLGDLNEPIDAMIYAMTAALGFAAIENVMYAIRFGNEVLLMRFLWPVPAHMAYAAVWGYGWSRWRFLQPRQSLARVVAPYVVAAGLTHAVVNYLLFQELLLTMLLSLGGLVGLAVLVHRGLLRLQAESPFLRPGECHACRHQNDPLEATCRACGAELMETEMFRPCSCGLTRIPHRLPDCPVCGLAQREVEQANDPPIV